MRKPQKLLIAAGGVILLVVIIAANLTTLKKQLQNIPFLRQPTPTPSKYANYAIPAPLPTGKQVYNVSRGSGSKGPNISQISVDNFDPKTGELQTYNIKITDPFGVEKVQLTLFTDYKIKFYEATLKDGKDTDGVWKAVVETEDSHDFVYRVRVEAQDSKEKSETTVTIR